MHEPELIIDWLATTIHLSAAARSFARIVARSSGQSTGDIMRGVKGISFETLRTARIKLDCVASLMFRKFWMQLPESSIFIYLYI